MIERIESAREGRKNWINLVDQYKINEKICVVVMPGKNKVYNEPALLYLKRFIEKRGFERALIITFDEWVLAQKNEYSKFADIIACSEETIESINQFYCLYEFATNIFFASLEAPSGRLGKGVIGKKEITYSEAFAGIVYGLLK